jgi:hypothetical protein
MTKIFAKTRWNDTKVDLIKGSQYKYEATGKWIDWFIECDADGFPPFLNSLMDTFWRNQKRKPSAKWFQLVGAINQNQSYTVELGTKGTFIAPENGRLWVYANDVASAYCNNRGYVELEIWPIQIS